MIKMFQKVLLKERYPVFGGHALSFPAASFRFALDSSEATHSCRPPAPQEICKSCTERTPAGFAPFGAPGCLVPWPASSEAEMLTDRSVAQALLRMLDEDHPIDVGKLLQQLLDSRDHRRRRGRRVGILATWEMRTAIAAAHGCSLIEGQEPVASRPAVDVQSLVAGDARSHTQHLGSSIAQSGCSRRRGSHVSWTQSSRSPTGTPYRAVGA